MFGFTFVPLRHEFDMLQCDLSGWKCVLLHRPAPFYDYLKCCTFIYIGQPHTIIEHINMIQNKLVITATDSLISNLENITNVPLLIKQCTKISNIDYSCYLQISVVSKYTGECCTKVTKTSKLI